LLKYRRHRKNLPIIGIALLAVSSRPTIYR